MSNDKPMSEWKQKKLEKEQTNKDMEESLKIARNYHKDDFSPFHPDYKCVRANSWVKMEGELSLYNLLAYHEDPDFQLSCISLDVYRRIKQHVNFDPTNNLYNTAWVSMNRLGVELGMASRTVSRHIRKLERVGLLKVTRFYRAGRKQVRFTVLEPMTEKDFTETFPEVVQTYKEKLVSLKKDKEYEEWYVPGSKAKKEKAKKTKEKKGKEK
jgi:DNA-binding transcriptional ArsR family regulator